MMTLRLSPSPSRSFMLLMFILWSRSTDVNSETQYVCEGGYMNLDCASGEVLAIAFASYGHWGVLIGPPEGHECPSIESEDEVCSATGSLQVVQTACEGEQTCQVQASNSVFGDPCSGQEKFLEVTFSCSSSSACPEGWEYDANGGNCYYFYETSETFLEVRDYCRGQGGDLVSIHSEEENVIVSDFISSVYVWIGLTDAESEGNFDYWLDGTTVTYTYWKSQNWQSDSNDCVVLWGHNGKWKWDDCSDSYYAVCKKSSQSGTTDASTTTNSQSTAADVTTNVYETTTSEIQTTSVLTTGSEAPGADVTSQAMTTQQKEVIPIASSEEQFISLELYLLTDEYLTQPATFRVNATVLLYATIPESFLPSEPLNWSALDSFSGNSVTVTEDTDQSAIVRFPAPSIYIITVTATGTDSELTATTNSTVLPTTALQCSSDAFLDEELWCALLTDVAVYHSNFTVAFDDTEVQVTGRPGIWTLDDLPDSLAGSISSFNGLLLSFVSHTFTKTGSRNVSAMIFDIMATQIQVDVMIRPLCINSVEIVSGYGNFSNPSVHLRCSNIHITAKVHLNQECVDPMSSEFTWRILTSTEDGNVVTAFEKTTQTSEVTLPSHTLDYGKYSLTLQLRTVAQESGDLLGKYQVTTWLAILPSHLTAVIKGGVSLSHGVNSPLTVDGSASSDPDVIPGSDSSLFFTWYCVHVDPDGILSSPEDALQYAGGPCFDDEGIILDSTSPMLQIPVDSLVVNRTLHFWLVVSLEGRTNGSAQQRVTVTAGASPQVQIECVSNCGAYINTAERLALHATCANCQNNDMVSYTWSEVTTRSTVSLTPDWSSLTTTGLNQAYLAIKPQAFASVVETGSYFLKLTAYSSNFSASGFAEYSLEFNAPPTPGVCLVDPAMGYALQTAFSITCQGFSDADTPLSYQLFVFTDIHCLNGVLSTSGEGFQLYEGGESRQEALSLPVGVESCNHTVVLKVNVRDVYQASTTVFLNTTVYPPAIEISENATELLTMSSSVESQVQTLVAEGDTGHAAQLISALGSVLNTIDQQDVNTDTQATKTEIRSNLMDTLAEIPVDSMVSLRQSSAALSVVTSNQHEVTSDMQEKAADTLSQMTTFLKDRSEAQTEGQGSIETAGTLLVEGLSNIFDAAEVTENLQMNSSLDGGGYQTQNQTNKNFSKTALSAIVNIQDAIAAGKIPSEEATIITAPSLAIAVSSISDEMLRGASLGRMDGSETGGFTMPADLDVGEIVQHGNGTAINMQMSTLKWNPFGWGHGRTINSSVVGIQLKTTGQTIQVQDLSSDINVYVPVPDSLSTESVLVAITQDFSASLPLNESSMPPVGGALHLTVIPKNEALVALSVCVANISINSTACTQNSTLVYASQDQNSNGNASFTWSVSTDDLTGADGIMISWFEGPSHPENTNANISLLVSIHTSSCVFWDEELEAWDSMGCQVGPLSTPVTTHCLCNHLSFFGSSLLVPPNKINVFGDAKLFLTFMDNPIVVTFVGTILLGYVFVAVWARRKDKRDEAKAAIIILEDNDPFQHYRYDITMVTGLRRGAGTTAMVTLTLMGNRGRSDPHVLHDKAGPVLTHGSTNSFLLTTAESLGEVQAIRLWHNNAGDSPQWYVSHCIVHDLESDERFYFLCNSWMMVGVEQMGLDRTFPAATPRVLHKFGHLFTSRTVRDLRDGHLWLSVLMRPKHSNFTCLQRVSCCLSLLMCAMMTSIMFYGVPNDPGDQVMDFGSFRITIKEIIIGIESSIIAFPINFLIVQIFRHIRPRDKPITHSSRGRYIVKHKRKLAGSLSSIDGDIELGLRSGTSAVPKNDKNGNSYNECKPSIVGGVSEHTQPSASRTSGRSVPQLSGGGEGSSTSTEDIASSKSRATTKSSFTSCISTDSTLFTHSAHKLVPRSLSDVMTEWDTDKGLRDMTSDVTSKENGPLNATGKEHSEMHTTGNQSDTTTSDDYGSSHQEGEGVTHNSFLYSRLMDVVKDLSTIHSDKFYVEEEHKQAMREAQTLVMTAVNEDTPPVSVTGSLRSQSTFNEENMMHHREKGLPYPCVYVGWVLVFFTVVASAYITMLYGLKYGKQGSLDWLASVFISTFQSIFITQPIKVLFMAIFLSLVFKQLEPEEDFSDDIEEQEVENAKETHNELKERRNTIAYYQPPPMSTADHYLWNKQLNARMYSLLWQIAGYLAFFYLLMTITYSQRDRQAFYLTQATKGVFFSNKDYELICDFRSFLTWADSTLLPGLLSDDRWGAEKQSTLIGGGLRLRQLRVKPDSCVLHQLFKGLINDCRSPFSRETEDRNFYKESWSQISLNDSEFFLTNRYWELFQPSPWRYHHDASMGVWGYRAVYPSSGYVWLLGSTYEEVEGALRNVMASHWLDERTKALFVEWTLYNANTNLFCVITFLLESTDSGDLTKLPEIQSVRLHRYAANYKLFIIMCEILFVLSVWFVSYREYLRYKPIGIKKYLSDRWNLLELAIIGNCLISAGLYTYRYFITKLLLGQMKDDSTKFVGFRSAASADIGLGYSLAVMIILSSAKFLYLLRLNPLLYLLTSVMSESLGEIYAFSLFLLLLSLTYAFSMSIWFGHLPTYRSIGRAFLTVFVSSTPGNFSYEELIDVNYIWGPLALLTFQYLAIYLFLNLLISVLNASMAFTRKHPPPPSDNRMIGLLLLSKIFSLLGIPERFHLELD